MSPRQQAGSSARLEALENRRLLSSSVIVQTNLVSDDTSVTPAQEQDQNLVNPWGLAAGPTSNWWIANQGKGNSTLYNTSAPQVTVNSLVVDVPANPGGGIFPDSPTGIVFNGGGGFNVTDEEGNTGSSVFVFATADGTISGWSPGVDFTNAIIGAVSPRENTIYLGLAIATDRGGETRLYASDFLNNKIDVYDTNFHQVATLGGNFTDPKLPADYHAFNIQAIDNELYVAYAPAGDILAGTAGPGQGAVNVYKADGSLKRRLIRPGNTEINQPWAIVKAPSNFGSFSNDLLIGNFGDGTISAFDPNSGRFEGQMQDADGDAIAIPHLWGLAFGNGSAAGPTNTLYFTAGLSSHLAPGPEPFHGLFGSLEVETGQGSDSASIVSAPATRSLTTSSSLLTVLKLDGASTIFLDGDPASLLI